ncbi:gluconate 2-dehydrogenase subunit 3 family protein [Neobacillus sp.]|uniref:gluconate 2-dehydrogenase subunit 3 family protein n=1 Tax=Neobacillus sp. TaxID=2675273 RepID=UPI00289D0B52|nr:gluconate 2-dehydrogenase subunit 3 family protein [Neobacillus sp.]
MSEQNDKNQMTRRQFLRKGSYVAGGAIGGGIIGGFITQQIMKPTTNITDKGHKAGEGRYTQALMYFSNPEDFKVLSQACERIFPTDDLGPGAIDLDVPYYIDHQLAGAWGNNARDFMLGPFYPGIETQGFQSHLKRNEIFSQGIARIQSVSQEKYKKNFIDLTDKEQDDVLTAFEKGKVPMQGVTSSDFFTLLRIGVLEGVYADPLYGGNRDMGGWKMKGFPGNQMSYLNQIEAKDFLDIKPVSLHSHMPQQKK